MKGQAVKDCDEDHKYPLNQLLIYPANNRDAGEQETGAWQAACREQVACGQQGTPTSQHGGLTAQGRDEPSLPSMEPGAAPGDGRACCRAASSRERAPAQHAALGTAAQDLM